MEKPIPSRSVVNRLVEPLEPLERHRKIDLLILDEDAISPREVASCDGVIFCKNVSQKSVEIAELAKQYHKFVVYDVDDDVTNFSNESFALLKKDNIKAILQKMFNLTDVVVFSTDFLKNCLCEKFVVGKYVVVETGFNFEKHKRKLSNNLNSSSILFTNADSIKLKKFKEDFFEVVNTFFERSPGLVLEVYSDPNPELNKFTSFVDKGSVPWEQHKRELGESSYRFAITPLIGREEAENLFFKCKTPIKYLEYGALSIPGIYSRSYIYENVVEDGRTGLLVNNSTYDWSKALDNLSRDQVLREKIAKNAYDDVFENHNITSKSEMWEEVLFNL